MPYEYRVFIELPSADTDAMHYSGEKLYEGAIFRVNKPGVAIDGVPVVVYRVVSHPGPDSAGIAYARTELDPASAGKGSTDWG
jgi:hypothetical protein